MMRDSAAVPTDLAVFVTPVYSSSSPADPLQATWIQGPVALQSFDLGRPQIIDGVYVRTPRPPAVPVFEPDLAAELESWDAASDEALGFFEEACD
jgi:hypothetical protein